MSPHSEYGNPRGSYRIYVDGSCQPTNPGTIGVGCVVIGPTGNRWTASQAFGQGTNNEAEYRAVVYGLTVARDFGAESVLVHSDSQLVVKQITGEWGVSSEHLVEFRNEARALLRTFDVRSAVTWIPREENREADTLARKAVVEQVRTNQIVKAARLRVKQLSKTIFAVEAESGGKGDQYAVDIHHRTCGCLYFLNKGRLSRTCSHLLAVDHYVQVGPKPAKSQSLVPELALF